MGSEDGAAVGVAVGEAEGAAVGADVGVADGAFVGIAVGAADGTAVGTAVGATVHCGLLQNTGHTLISCCVHWRCSAGTPANLANTGLHSGSGSGTPLHN